MSESYAFLDRLPTGFLCNSSSIPVVELRTPAPMELVGGERLDTTGPVHTLGVPVGRHGLADWRAAVSRLSVCQSPGWRLASTAAARGLSVFCSGLPGAGLLHRPVRSVPLRGWESTTLACHGLAVCAELVDCTGLPWTARLDCTTVS